MHGKGFWAVAAACLALTAILISGCGSSDSSGSATAENTDSASLTKQQYIAQANQICEQGLTEKDQAVSPALKELASNSEGAPTAQATAKLVEEAVLPSYRKMIDQLGQLNAPTGSEAKVKAIVGDFESSLEKAEADPAKAAQGGLFMAGVQAARAYGLQACRL